MNPAGGPLTEPTPPPPPSTAPSTLRRDLLSAYAASGARVFSWVVVSAIVFRADPLQFAVLALIRGTVGLLNYTTLGLAPAMVKLLAEARASTAGPPAPQDGAGREVVDGRVPGYETPSRYVARERDPAAVVAASGWIAAILTGVAGVVLSAAYAAGFDTVHDIPPPLRDAAGAAFLMGLGTVLRLASEAPAAVLQTSGAFTTDNLLVAAADAAWAAFVAVTVWFVPTPDVITLAAAWYTISGFGLIIARRLAANAYAPSTRRDHHLFDWATVRRLISLGIIIALAQLADFLYAPANYILINRFVSPEAVAWYAPAVQIDAGLLLLVGALSAVLLPKAALAHVAGDVATLRRYYVRGTLAAAGLLVLAAPVVYALSPWVFRYWLGDPLPQTVAILPLVLIHTVLGGSSGVGRSILLAMGKAKPFAVAMLVAGVGNVLLSYGLVTFGGLGLKGIVYGTIVTAVGRCVLWQPWYVMRTLNRSAGLPQTVAADPAVAAAAARAMEPL